MAKYSTRGLRYKLLFSRYREITERCLELGAKMDSITNEESSELRRLLKEQAWLTKTVTRQVQGILEELREGLGRIESWIAAAEAKVSKAVDSRGMPADILDLEEIMNKGTELREGVRNLDSKPGLPAAKKGRPARELPPAAEIRIDIQADEDSKEAVGAAGREIRMGKEEAAPARTGGKPVGEDSIIFPGELCRDVLTKLEKKLVPEVLVAASTASNSSSQKSRKKGRKKKNK